MSFILDALKKSENERQGQGGLAVADVPVIRELPGSPRWIWWLIGLLAVNLLVLLAVLLRPAVPETGRAADATQPATESARAATISRRSASGLADMDTADDNSASAPDTVAPVLAAVVDRARSERLEDAPEAPSSDSATAPAGGATPTGQPEVTPVSVIDSPVPSRQEIAEEGQEILALPTLDELRVGGETDLPDLHVDIHVYSEEPAGRFVYINTAKYREGSQLAEGPRVQAITEEGVVLQHRGARFLLPRE